MITLNREFQRWYQSNKWFATLVILVVIQFVIIINHSYKGGASQKSELICPHFLVGDDSKDTPTYIQEDRRYMKWQDNWDGRQFNRPVRDVMRRMILVRHGEYHKQGTRNGHLTTLGVAQAHMVGERLKALNFTVHQFIASGSQRAHETAEIIHMYIPHVTIHVTDELKEGWPTYPEPPEGFDPTHPAFKQEGWRLDQAFRKFIHRPETGQMQDSTDIIVAHGNVIGNFVLRVMQLQPERWLRVNIYQGSITIIEIDSAGMVRLRSLGDVGHIPRKSWTG